MEASFLSKALTNIEESENPSEDAHPQSQDTAYVVRLAIYFVFSVLFLAFLALKYLDREHNRDYQKEHQKAQQLYESCLHPEYKIAFENVDESNTKRILKHLKATDSEGRNPLGRHSSSKNLIEGSQGSQENSLYADSTSLHQRKRVKRRQSKLQISVSEVDNSQSSRNMLKIPSAARREEEHLNVYHPGAASSGHGSLINYSQYSESGHHSKQSKRTRVRKVIKKGEHHHGDSLHHSEHRHHHGEHRHHHGEHHHHSDKHDQAAKVSKLAKIVKMVSHHHHHHYEPKNSEAILPNSDSIVSSALSGSQRGTKKRKRISSKGMAKVGSVGDSNRVPMAHIPDVDEDKYDSLDQDHYIKQK